MREKYIAYMRNMITLAGARDADARPAVAGVMKIETALAQASLSRAELSTCCLVLLAELGLAIVQNLADRLQAGRGDRRGGVRSRTTA